MEIEWLWAHKQNFNSDIYLYRKILFEICFHVFFITRKSPCPVTPYY